MCGKTSAQDWARILTDQLLCPGDHISTLSLVPNLSMPPISSAVNFPSFLECGEVQSDLRDEAAERLVMGITANGSTIARDPFSTTEQLVGSRLDSFESLATGADGLTRVQRLASSPDTTRSLPFRVIVHIHAGDSGFTNHPLSKYKDVCTPTHDLQQRLDRPDIRSHSRTSNHKREHRLTHAAQETSAVTSVPGAVSTAIEQNPIVKSFASVSGAPLNPKTLNDDIRNLVTTTENVGPHEVAVRPATMPLDISDSFDEVLMTMEDLNTPGLDFLDDSGDVDTSGDEPFEVNTNHWMSLADRNILYCLFAYSH
ncbi:hypothetical protein FALBO_16784 [Fusarium albosuccineum]|uniref:Uncharacterized protein n=1 Tax=Fusarium albosuccineum TaxID=1237068 RepID=A0A8H4KE82_9HYPO|nr:hypothetical protein FALBO_16784 [Fusarium albosuccineum]